MDSSMELKEYGRILKKWLWLIATCIIFACTTTAIVSYYFLEPVYQASTKLIVNHSRENDGILKQIDLNEVNVNIKLIDTYKEIIKTDAVMDKVVEQYPELNLTAGQLINKVQVSSVNNTQVMTLSVKDGSYEQAVKIVNAIATVFQQAVPQIYNVDNVQILSTAKMVEDPSPVEPNPVLNIMVSFILALMLSVGIAFLLEYLDDTIKTEADISNVLGVPTYAVISVIQDKDFAPRNEKSVKQKVGEVPYATTTAK
ncbi:YveK family protein [Paenibacillus sp.]|uniref:YveK family protein n=1 Tax=Paenibacillus sp. TaxID=58172 RepID=UPI002D24280F|nr:Wzz/FepE/Etk N-terminal domain-containing protein [Paenibacillus sp.]HZG84920.1 Wzz/FepE/Etk N-terminal domain-containing protein [Paenibacillus sp.]